MLNGTFELNLLVWYDSWSCEEYCLEWDDIEVVVLSQVSPSQPFISPDQLQLQLDTPLQPGLLHSSNVEDIHPHLHLHCSHLTTLISADGWETGLIVSGVRILHNVTMSLIRLISAVRDTWRQWLSLWCRLYWNQTHRCTDETEECKIRRCKRTQCPRN